MRVSELKWELRKRQDGRLRIYVTSVEKELSQCMANAAEYERKFRKHLEQAGEYNSVDVIINSHGGACASAMGMTRAMESIRMPGRFLIDGACGSAATLIPCALNGKVYITPTSHYYIHRATIRKYHRDGTGWRLIGTMQKGAVDNLLRHAYKTKTKQKWKVIREWMANGTRFSPQEAVDARLCDGIMTRAEFDKE